MGCKQRLIHLISSSFLIIMLWRFQHTLTK